MYRQKMISKCYGKVNKRQALDLNLSRKLIRRLIGWQLYNLSRFLNVMVAGLLLILAGTLHDHKGSIGWAISMSATHRSRMGC